MAVMHATQRISSFGTILRAFNIKYTSRASVKGQFLTDLVAETAEPLPDEMTEAQHVDGKLVGTVSLHGILCPKRCMLITL